MKYILLLLTMNLTFPKLSLATDEDEYKQYQEQSQEQEPTLVLNLSRVSYCQKLKILKCFDNSTATIQTNNKVYTGKISLKFRAQAPYCLARAYYWCELETQETKIEVIFIENIKKISCPSKNLCSYYNTKEGCSRSQNFLSKKRRRRSNGKTREDRPCRFIHLDEKYYLHQGLKIFNP